MEPNDRSLQEELEPASDPRFAKAIEEIERRCSAAGIQIDQQREDDYFAVSIEMPAGRAKRPVDINDLDQALGLLSLPFEDWVFLGDYDAICCYQNGTIEAAVSGIGTFSVGIASIKRRLFGLADSRQTEPAQLHIELESKGQVRATLSVESKRLAQLIQRPAVYLELTGLSISTQDEAIRILELVSDAFFFEVDTRFNLPLGIRKVRRPMVGPTPKSDNLARKSLQFPSCRYDKQPLSLYWYGRSATSMPLLQFLAFYQSIEFYFPVYSQKETIRQLQRMLKDPRFSAHDEADVSRLLSAIQIGRAGGFGDERSQFRATVQNCTSSEDLRLFFSSDERISEFYSDQARWKTISREKVPINNADADLRMPVADRLYDIRCKIVHSKADGGPSNSDMLLPFSKEADMLRFDIALSRHLAVHVLTMSSSQLAL